MNETNSLSQPMGLAFRVEAVTPRHVRFAVFLGRGTRAHCGTLTVTLDEFAWLLGSLPDAQLTGRAELLPEGIR